MYLAWQGLRLQHRFELWCRHQFGLVASLVDAASLVLVHCEPCAISHAVANLFARRPATADLLASQRRTSGLKVRLKEQLRESGRFFPRDKAIRWSGPQLRGKPKFTDSVDAC